MTNRKKYNNVDDFLSMKRIIILSLAITFFYYFLYILNHYFGRPSFASSNNTEIVRDGQEDSQDKTAQFDEAQKQYGNFSEEEFIKEIRRRRNSNFVPLILFNFPWTFLMVFVVFLYIRKIMSLPIKRQYDEVGAIVVGSMLIVLVLSTLCTLSQLWAFPEHPGPPRTTIQFIKKGYLGDLPTMIFVIMASYLSRSLYREKNIAVENETLRVENIRTRYETLKNQLDPHFLFNSMNTLKSLIEADTVKAEEFVQQLSSVLRYTLQNKEVVTLAEELDCVESYCSMMQIRYGNNLKFDFSIDSKYLNYYVLPLSLQGLIENAVKHNVISSRLPLTVKVVTDGDTLKVTNVKQPKVTEEDGNGIGLANLTERYRLKWEEKVDIFDDGTIFSVTLPLKENI